MKSLLLLCKFPGFTFRGFVFFGLAVALCANSCGQQINVTDLSISVLVSMVLAGATALTCGIPSPGRSR